MAKKQVRLVLRIPIRVTINSKKTGETLETSTYTKQTPLGQFIQLTTKEYGNKNVTFTARVMYHRTKDSYNEFEFTDKADFDRKLEPCLERSLLKDLLKDGMLVKEYVQGV